jgi:putative FmdB family regulatory protein
MPLYEYACEVCGEVTEVLQRLADAPPSACPKCGGALRKMASAPALQFKGTGWYVTDYAGRGKKKQEALEASGGSGSSSSGSSSSSSASSSSSSSTTSGSSSSSSTSSESKPSESKPAESKPATPGPAKQES